MSALLHAIEARWAALEGRAPWRGHDLVLVTATDPARAAAWQARLEDLHRYTLRPVRVIALVDDRPGLGNLRGTARAWRAACALTPELPDRLADGARALLLHDAGLARRTGGLAAAFGGRAAQIVPGSWGLHGDSRALTLGDLAVAHAIDLAPGGEGRLDVLWGSQVLAPAGPVPAPDAPLVKWAVPGAATSTDLGRILARDGRLLRFVPAGSGEAAPNALADAGGARFRLDLLEALAAWEALLPDDAPVDLDPGLLAAWSRDRASWEAALPALRDGVGVAALPEGSGWWRWRRPEEVRAHVSALAAGDRALRAAHRVRWPVEACRLGDVWIDGPELRFEDVDAGLSVGGVQLQGAVLRGCALEAGSRVEDAAAHGLSGTWSLEASWAVDAAGAGDLHESVALGILASDPLRATRALLLPGADGAPVGTHIDATPPLSASTFPRPNPGISSEDASRLAGELDADSLLDLALSGAPTQAQAGTRAIFAPIIAQCDALDPEARGAAARDLCALWPRLAAHPAAGELGAALAEALAADGLVSADALLARHDAIRSGSAWKAPADPRLLLVLSRVTVGADIALTAPLLARLHARFPRATLLLVAAAPTLDLLGELPGVRGYRMAYPRGGTLLERVDLWRRLRLLVHDLDPDAVVAADSRLDQLGTLPLSRPERTLLVEPTADLGTGNLSAAVNRRFDALCGAGDHAPPRLGLPPAERGAQLAIKLDVGGDRAKALPFGTEVRLLAEALQVGEVALDAGLGAAEAHHAARVDLALREAGHTPPARHQGGLATWAAITAGARAALACDSAHGHLAAALGVPTTVLFHASVPERFRRAWTPSGPARALALSASELDSLSLAEALP